MSVARFTWLGIALVPAKAFGADSHAFDQLTLRIRPLRVFGIDLGVVELAKFDGIDPQPFRHLVHRDLQRHHPRRLAGCAHRIALGQIQRRQPQRRHSIGAGIEQPRLPDRAFWTAALEVAGPAFMADRHDLAVAAGADPDPLNGRGPMGGVIENQRPLQRQLDRAPGRARAKSGQNSVGANEQLAAEATADERRHQPHIFLGQPERLGNVAMAPGDHLVRCVERELVAVPFGGRGVRLHHRMRLIGRAVGRVQLHRR